MFKSGFYFQAGGDLWRPFCTHSHPTEAEVTAHGMVHSMEGDRLSNGSILICMELLRSTSESGQEAAACCLVVPKGTWPLIILLPDQVHRRTCLYLQSGRKINYSLWCLYQHLSRHTGPQHFLVYCSVRMAKYFFITINSGQLNFA
jgi:hypothetical protein